MRKFLLIVALTIGLMAAFAVTMVLQDQESGQVAAAVTRPPVAEGERSVAPETVSESPTQELLGSASVTGASDSEYGGVGNPAKLDHDGVCPFQDRQL